MAEITVCNLPKSRRTRKALLDVGAGVVRLLERDIERTCTEFFELDGWRCLKTDPVSRHEWGKGFGEPGMADDVYIRYANDDPYRRVPGGYRGDQPDYRPRQWAEVLWVEYKRQRGGKITSRAEKAKIHQRQWHAAERARGALTLIVGEDCPATIEGVRTWYSNSGLARRVRPETVVARA